MPPPDDSSRRPAGRPRPKTPAGPDPVTVRVEAGSAPARIVVSTPVGDAAVITVAPEAIELSTPNGDSVVIGPAGIAVAAAAKVSVAASQVEVSAGTLTVNAGMSTFSGVVRADTVITNSVISASYTPGAGNVW